MARTALIALVLLLSLWTAHPKPMVAGPPKHVQTGSLELVHLHSQAHQQFREYSLPLANLEGQELTVHLGDISAPTYYERQPEGIRGCELDISQPGVVRMRVEAGSVEWEIKVRFIMVASSLGHLIFQVHSIEYPLTDGLNESPLPAETVTNTRGLPVKTVALLQAWKAVSAPSEISLRMAVFNHTLTIKSLNIGFVRLTLLNIDEQGLLPHKIILSPSVSLTSDPYAVQLLRAEGSSVETRVTTVNFLKYKCPMGSLWMYGTHECVATCQKKVGEGRYQVCFESQANLRVGVEQPRFLYYGYGVTCSWASCPGSWTTAASCQLCGSSYKIMSCVTGYYLRNEGCHSCSLSQCTACYWSNWRNKQICTSCASGYYVKSGTCHTCPDTCTGCNYSSFLWWSGIRCTTCVGNLVVLDKMCECYSNQYMLSSPSYSCVNCPSGCKYCSWDGSTATCTACENGYYLSGGACPACMRVCATCSSGSTCDTPVGNLVMNGNVAECGAGLFFDNSTLTCEACTSFHANCATCDYNPSPFDPANIAPVECTVADATYYVENGTTFACGSYCDGCINASYCTTPTATFTVDPVSGVSYCDDTLPTPLYITNSAPYSCEPCETVITGCLACQNNTATECTSCGNGYYAATAVPVSTCTQCGSLCSTCNDGATCSGCINNLQLNGGTFACECTAPDYLHPTSNTCEACPGLILHCNTCSYSAPNFLCSVCDDSFYVAGDSLSCIACSDPTCLTCNAAGDCLSCEPGYTQSGTACICDANCGLCQGNVAPECVACTGGFAPCTACIVGTYDAGGGACTSCPVTCDECSYNSTSTQV